MQTLKISPNLFGMSRSSKHQKFILVPLKTGISNKVYVMRRLHYMYINAFARIESSV